MKSPRLNWPSGFRLAYSPDGRRLACTGQNIVVVDLLARRRVFTSHPFSNPSSIAFSPRGETLAVKSTSGRMVVMDSQSGEVLFDHKNHKEGEGSGVCFSPDGDALVDGSWNGALTVRSALGGTVLSREQYPGEMIDSITHDQKGRNWLFLHSVKVRPGEDKKPPDSPDYVSMRRWPFAPETTQTFSYGTPLAGAALSPEGSHICFSEYYDQKRIHIAGAADGKILATSVPMEGPATALSWSGDGQHVAAVSDRFMVFLSVSDLAIVGGVRWEWPYCVAFSPDGEDVALGMSDTTKVVKLRDILRGYQLTGGAKPVLH